MLTAPLPPKVPLAVTEVAGHGQRTVDVDLATPALADVQRGDGVGEAGIHGGSEVLDSGVVGEEGDLTDVTLNMGSNSAVGGYAQGILGCYNTTGTITLIHCWNWYAGTSSSSG